MKNLTICFSKSLLIFVIVFLHNSCGENENGITNEVNYPNANFTIDQTVINLGTSIQFTDQSSNSPKSWSWDFGDGYTVSLTITNDYGTDTEIKSNFITVIEDPNSLFDLRDYTTYNIIKIGDQWWLGENLHYDAGTGSWPCGGIIWSSDPICYGWLYNWETACQVCPDGWHLPSDAEWKQLEVYIGMSQSDADIEGEWRGTDEGSKLKATFGWRNNGNGTNSSGFSALPGGRHHYLNYFEYTEEAAYYWSSSTTEDNWAYYRVLYYRYDNILRSDMGKIIGLSVRCVQD